MEICRECGREKPTSWFNPSNPLNGYITGYCRYCMKYTNTKIADCEKNDVISSGRFAIKRTAVLPIKPTIPKIEKKKRKKSKQKMGNEFNKPLTVTRSSTITKKAKQKTKVEAELNDLLNVDRSSTRMYSKTQSQKTANESKINNIDKCEKPKKKEKPVYRGKRMKKFIQDALEQAFHDDFRK